MKEAEEAIEHGGFGCDSTTVIVRRPGVIGARMHCVRGLRDFLGNYLVKLREFVRLLEKVSLIAG